MPARRADSSASQGSSGHRRGFAWGFVTALVLVAAAYGVRCWFWCPMGAGCGPMGAKGCPMMSAPATPAPAAGQKPKG